MDSTLSKVCETYISNRDELRRIFRSYGRSMHLMGAAVLTAAGKKPNEEKLLASEEFLRSKENDVSPIRGPIKTVTSVHMSLSDSTEKYYTDLKRTYDLIRINRGSADEKYYLAAMMMSEHISNMVQILLLVDRAGSIYEEVGKLCKQAGGHVSYPTSAFGAVTGITNIKEYVKEVGAIRAAMSESDAISALTEDMCMIIGMIPQDTKIKCDRAKDIYSYLDKIGFNFTGVEEGGCLGFLTGLDMPAEEIAAALYDADDFLKEYSGFIEDGNPTILRHIYAAMLTSLAYLPERGVKEIKTDLEKDKEALKRIALMQTQMAMDIQMQYVDREELHI